TNIIQNGVNQFNSKEKNLSIVHIIINKYFIDDKLYNFFPKNIKFKKIILEIELICLDKSLLKKIRNLFDECKIKINKIVSFEYAKQFLNNIKDDTMCISANKVVNGVNQSEIYIEEELSKKTGIFYKIFDIFD
ncbi:hypothetical protein N9U84_04110, partial [Candidatus Pelagibacter sp.]|nr:hypothetical protein [Candidatus Pelagibacter sp.]